MIERWERDSNVPVILYEGGVPVSVGMAREISLQGVYVEIGEVPFRRHQILEVGFSIHDDLDDIEWCRIPSIVVDRDALGIRLMFDEEDLRTRKAVQALLRERRRATG
ncbi:MAG TPA: hypothetical protein ENK54_00060 [Thiotrichales bacterium]|nr:hypothetical protein [Thiotrichales bacterium]